MDYKEKYENALEWMREIYPTMEGFVKEDAEHCFPELKESEDERIRKALVDMVRIRANESDKKKFIAYLERQKEQKPEEKISVSEELYEHIRNACACIEDAMSSDTMCDMTDYLTMADSSAQKAFDMVERLVIKKPAESDAIKGGDFISDGKRVFLVLANVKERNLGETGSTFCEGHILGVDGVVYCDGGDFKKFKRATSDERAKFIHDLKVGVKLKERPAEWSKEDKDTLGDAITAVDMMLTDSFHDSHPNLFKAFLIAKNFLKSLPERFNLQSKQEWSQKDNEFADDAIACVTRCDERYCDNKDFYQSLRHNTLDIKRWLIDVRKRLTPHWKPSEAQMQWLESAVKLSTDKPEIHGIIISLYEQLKRL